MNTLAFSCVVLLLGGLHAQSVVPASLTNAPGAGSSNFPFGLSTACRIQNAYGASETGVAALAIRAIEFRGNEGTSNVAKSSIMLQIEMSTTSANPVALASTFAGN